MTLSIVALDASENVVGAAVTSCALAAARRILHVSSGVGAAVAQGASEITWGDDILDRLAAGAAVTDAIAPYSRDDNQVAAIRFDGTVAVHSGDDCVAFVSERTEHGVSCQANTARLPDAAVRMFDAFHATSGPLAERLVAALAASGGDSRGEQGAGLIVVGNGPLRGYEDEPHVDLRVDDHRQPVAELQRLLELHRAHCKMRSIQREPATNQQQVLQALLLKHPDDPHLQRALNRATAEPAK